MPDFVKVAKVSDVPAGSGKIIESGGKTIAMFNCEGKFYAIENTCKHRGGPLGEGMLSQTKVSCPWHGWEYDVTTGSCSMDPAISVATFPVKIEGDDVFVSL
ncbi:MAG: nitrite reductase small subunit NirD [Candidatus Omnitrophica bacterium]|nr:nitrite reductase small subunit NirD [Candidatus Omnitrophota bacterium]MBI2174833.1 nitrite reductase small subunit NirD [Candidatus Omnitrophota bacterium]MBI3010420.1 nitrite reductase small subunit NirD [Candidatus Omnitrophota bacterium]